MTEEMTRAAKKPATTGRKTSTTAKKKTSTTATKKKTSTTAAKKKPATTTAKKKPAASTAAKKKTSSTSSKTFRLSAAEKKIITNYRKCNALMKKLIGVLAEKGSGNMNRAEVEGLTRGSMENLLDDQGDLL